MNVELIDAHMPRTALDDSWIDTVDRLQDFVAARVDDRELAADITQDVIMRSIASGALDRVDNPVAWLYRSARNAVIDHYRLRRRHQPPNEDNDRWTEPESDDGGPNDATRDLARCLQPLVEQLPAMYRDALIRVDLHGETHRQAAAATGISESGMKSRVQRGRHQLRDVLTACCAVHTDSTGAIESYRAHEGRCASNCQGPIDQ